MIVIRNKMPTYHVKEFMIENIELMKENHSLHLKQMKL